MDKKKEYICNQCKARTWARTCPEYCVCGGKFQPTDSAVMDVFNDIFKEKK